jgi:hypothetical protein
LVYNYLRSVCLPCLACSFIPRQGNINDYLYIRHYL